MSVSIADTYGPLLDAIAFAARAHRTQIRKDKETPYVSHVFRVSMILRQVFEISDTRVLTAAVLHDTIEDTTTDFDDIKDAFDDEIASWVAMLSKDTRQEEEPRELAYCKVLSSSPWQVQVCKLADIFDNLLDMGTLTLAKQIEAIDKKRRYLEAIQVNLRPEAREAFVLTAQLADELEANLKKRQN